MYYALKNDREKALQNLENAILYGYTNLDWITTAKSLAAIRDDERYKRLVEGLKNGEKKN